MQPPSTCKHFLILDTACLQYGGAISATFGLASLTISDTTFSGNTCGGCPAPAVYHPTGEGTSTYTNDEANAAFGGEVGRRLLAVKIEAKHNSLPIKIDDSAGSLSKALDSKSVAAVDFADPLQVRISTTGNDANVSWPADRR
eukprot:SAG22_NODE_110_length_19679_cov_45.046527_2_plen_143_part_00